MGGLQLCSLALSLAAAVLLARMLGPEGFGQYSFVFALVTILSLPLDQGMRQLVTREVAGYHHGEQWDLLRGLLFRTHQWVLLGAASIILVLGGIAASRATWQASDRWSLLLAALPALPFLGLNGLRGATLRGLGYIVQAQIPELLVRPALYLVFAVTLLALGLLSPAKALMGQVFAAVGAFLFGAYLLRRHWPKELRMAGVEYNSSEWARAWLPFTLLMAVSLLNGQISILLLGWLGTDAQVGALRVADRGSQLVSMSLQVVNLVIGPQITRAFRANDYVRLQKLFTQSARGALIIALPVSIPLIFFSKPIIALIFGARYVDLAALPLAVLAGAQLGNVVFGSVGMFLIMSGYERDSLVAQVVALLVNFVVALALIPTFGTVGATISVAIGLFVWNLLLAFKLKRRLGLRPTVF